MEQTIAELFGAEFAGGFFLYALPWLLTFAIVYGILSMIGDGIPKSNSSRAMIAIVLAFFSMIVAEPLMGFLQAMGGSAIVVLTGFIFFIIILELTQTGGGAHDLIGEYPRLFGLVLLIIIVVLFLGSGGAAMIGLTEIVPPIDPATMFFLVVIVLVIWWMISEGNEDDED